MAAKLTKVHFDSKRTPFEENYLVVIKASGKQFPWISSQVLTNRAIHTVLNKSASMLVIVDVQTASTLNGHAKENDGA
jgi:glucan phosphoethanolaminetransferase (alkaline phosphatase superfamily)